MKRKRYSDEQIAFALRQAEGGTAVEEIDPAPDVPSFISRVRSPYASAWGGMQKLLG